MKRAAIIVLLAATGCASSTSIEHGAHEHLAKAQALESQGDHYGAARERAAAQKQFNKAHMRAYQERYYGVYY